MSKDGIKPVKINSLEIENVKRVQLVSFAISPDGLTLIGAVTQKSHPTLSAKAL